MTPQHSRLSRPKYRPDIDGLRAIAVVSVVAYHAFPNWIRGGFTGVDVFFVVSGFLITTVICENLDRETFGFAEFYARRIKRIFPALILVLVASYAFGKFALLSDENKQLGRHIAAGAGFVSNFILWSEAGYFDNSAATKPLLHLWSLGIEEQFYIIWPLLLWLAWKRKFNRLTLTVVLALASFYLNVKGVRADAIAAFYSPLTRVWELLCGGLLAWVTIDKKSASVGVTDRYVLALDADGEIWVNVLSFLGLALLCFGFWGLSRDVPFPGQWAIVPVLGAVAIIFAGPKAWLNRIVLSNKIAVGLGLISFPLYLWHWPLLSFARIVESEVPGRSLRMGAVVLSTLLAWITYQFVERPLRFGLPSSRKTIFLVLMMFLAGVLGYRVSQQDLSERKAGRELWEAKTNCDVYFPDWTKVTDNPCLLQRKTGNSIALIGDSHAGHLFVGLSELMAPNQGVALFSASCAAPYIDVSTAQKDLSARKVREGAYKLINRAYDYVMSDARIKTVILAHHPSCSYYDALDVTHPENKDFRNVLREGMRRSFKALIKANKRVIVVFDNPYSPLDPKQCMPRPFRITQKDDHCYFSREKFDQIPAVVEYRSLVESVLKEFPQVRTVDLSEPFCDATHCYLSRAGQLMYLDRGHLNFGGSRYVAPYLMKAIEKM